MKKQLKIVKILDEYNVVINGGTRDNVSINDKFQILDKKGSLVIDPDTGEEIGYLDLIKATVTVTEVQEKMCICTSPKYNVIDSPFSDIGSMIPNFYTVKRDKLNVDNKQITGGLRKSNTPIKIGDSVQLIKKTK